MTIEELMLGVDVEFASDDERTQRSEVKILQRPSNQWEIKNVFYDKESDTLFLEI